MLDADTFCTLPLTVGVQRAKELMLSARKIDMPEALQWGPVTELPAHQDLLPRAQALAASFVSASPVGMPNCQHCLSWRPKSKRWLCTPKIIARWPTALCQPDFNQKRNPE